MDKSPYVVLCMVIQISIISYSLLAFNVHKIWCLSLILSDDSFFLCIFVYSLALSYLSFYLFDISNSISSYRWFPLRWHYFYRFCIRKREFLQNFNSYSLVLCNFDKFLSFLQNHSQTSNLFRSKLDKTFIFLYVFQIFTLFYSIFNHVFLFRLVRICKLID